MANTFFYPPPDHSSGVLFIPTGTPLTVLWTCNYNFLNLRVFQENSDGSYTFNTLLSDVSNPPGNGSYAWVADFLDSTAPALGMHFEITSSSNGQSLDPFNSAVFYVNNASAISTSLASSSTTSSTASLSASTSIISTSSTTSGPSTGSPSSSPTSNPQHTSKVGLGVGLGLGIPVFLLIITLLGWTLSRRRQKYQAAPVVELADPAEDYKHEVPEHGPSRAELEGEQEVQEVHEAPA